MIRPPEIQRVPIPTKGLSVFRRMWNLVTYPMMWEIKRDWYCDLPDGTKIVVPKGFIYDGASFPRIVRWIPGMSPTGILLIPGTIHDYGYRYDRLLLATSDLPHEAYCYMEGAGKEYWDKLFEEVSLMVNDALGVEKIAYIVVKYFGGRAWRNRRKGKPETR